jgi:hypothetical protein
MQGIYIYVCIYENITVSFRCMYKYVFVYKYMYIYMLMEYIVADRPIDINNARYLYKYMHVYI